MTPMRLWPVVLLAGALCLLPVVAHAQTDLRIHIPAQSSMQLYAPDAYTSLVSFSGEQRLQGRLLARAEQTMLDDEPQWRVSLWFVPAAAARAALPRVQVSGEPEAEVQAIALAYFDEAAMTHWISTVFGADIAARIGASAFVVATEGTATLRDYRTGIECDSRDHYAMLAAFEPARKLASRAAQTLSAQLPGRCGQ